MTVNKCSRDEARTTTECVGLLYFSKFSEQRAVYPGDGDFHDRIRKFFVYEIWAI